MVLWCAAQEDRVCTNATSIVTLGTLYGFRFIYAFKFAVEEPTYEDETT